MEPSDEGDNSLPDKKSDKKKMFPYRYVYLIIIVVIFILLIYIFLSPLFVDLEGQPAPDFSVNDIDGNEFTLSEQQGKVVVLDIMTLSCPACIEEMEHLRAISTRYSQDELAIVTISIDSKDSKDAIDNFRTKHGANWTFVTDTDGVANKYKVSYIPTIVVIDKEGVIRYWGAGEISAPRLSSEIDKWL